jgi:hypothetical protein
MCINDGSETQEQGGSIMWARASLRMELYSKARLPNNIQTFNGSVVGIDVANFDF